MYSAAIQLNHWLHTYQHLPVIAIVVKYLHVTGASFCDLQLANDWPGTPSKAPFLPDLGSAHALIQLVK